MDEYNPTGLWELRYCRRKKIVASEVFKGTWEEAWVVAKANGPTHKHIDSIQVAEVKALGDD